MSYYLCIKNNQDISIIFSTKIKYENKIKFSTCKCNKNLKRKKIKIFKVYYFELENLSQDFICENNTIICNNKNCNLKKYFEECENYLVMLETTAIKEDDFDNDTYNLNQILFNHCDNFDFQTLQKTIIVLNFFDEFNFPSITRFSNQVFEILNEIFLEKKNYSISELETIQFHESQFGT